MPLNHVTVEGWLQYDPEVKTFEGKESLAVNLVLSCYTGIKGLSKFRRVRVFGQPSKKEGMKSLVETAAELKAGDRLVVEGKFTYFEQEKNGTRELGETIQADGFRVFGHNDPKPKESQAAKASADDFASFPDDIPF